MLERLELKLLLQQSQCRLQKLKHLLLKNTSAPGPTNQKIYIVAIGVSTGYPNALAELFPTLSGDLPVPIVLVQHMPPFFTKLLAERLLSKSPADIQEGKAEE